MGSGLSDEDKHTKASKLKGLLETFSERNHSVTTFGEDVSQVEEVEKVEEQEDEEEFEKEEEPEEETREADNPAPLTAPAALPGVGNYGGLKIDLSALTASKSTSKPRSKLPDRKTVPIKKEEVDPNSLQASGSTSSNEHKALSEETLHRSQPLNPVEAKEDIEVFHVNNLP